nr:otopetrin [Hymenolepis microstoma]
METVISFALPIVEAFEIPKRVQRKYHLEVLKIIPPVVSVISMAYLQALMCYYKKQKHDCEVEMKTLTVSNEDELSGDQIKSANNKKEGSNVDFIEDESQRSSVPNFPYIDETNFENGVISDVDEKGLRICCTGGTIDSKEESCINGSPLREIELESAEITVKRRVLNIGKMFGDDTQLDKMTIPPFIESTEGSNLYLRLGAVIFGFGVMIMDGFRVADQFDLSNSALECHSALWIPVNVIHSIFIFWQTYFLFKYHRVIFNVQKFFVRFILCHMTVVNLGQWLSTVVQEIMISDDGNESVTTLRLISNSNITTNSTLRDTCKSQVGAFVHFLIPCGVEYSLIACAIFFKMFRQVGHVPEIKTMKCQGLPNLKLRPESEYLSGDDSTECRHAHKGLFAGLFLVMSTIVALAFLYTYLHQHNYFEALIISQVTDICLLSIGVLTGSVVLYQIRVLCLSQLSEERAFDNNLLLVGLLGILFYNTFLLVPALGATGELQLMGCMFVSKAILEIFQALMQVFLILVASRSQVTNEQQMIDKPGRSLITFLLILNLAMWVASTFGLKHAEKYEIHRTHYSDIAWKIITYLSLPLIIFFRFHSTICLADIWLNAYRMHSHELVK